MTIRKPLLYAIAVIILSMLLVECSTMFSSTGSSHASPRLAIGLVLTDCEDDWKQEMYDSIQSAARQRAIQVTTVQTARTQADQIDAIRKLLVYQMDAIIFSPVMENGWDYILSEAAETQIPLITINERLSPSAASELRKSGGSVYHVGYDYDTLARSLSLTMRGADPAALRLVQLSGSVGSSVSHDISFGFQDVLAESGPYQLCFSVGGDYMRSRASELIRSLLRNQYQFNAVLSYSDGMTLGVIDALERSGLTAGEDVQIFSVGGGPSISEAFAAGKINALAQCDLSDFGDTVIELVHQLGTGEQPEEQTLLSGTLLVNGGRTA